MFTNTKSYDWLLQFYLFIAYKYLQVLHNSFSSRTGDVVRLLTDYGADPNALMEGILENGDIRRFTCLHLAVLTGHTEAATALVEKGATVNVEVRKQQKQQQQQISYALVLINIKKTFK